MWMRIHSGNHFMQYIVQRRYQIESILNGRKRSMDFISGNTRAFIFQKTDKVRTSRICADGLRIIYRFPYAPLDRIKVVDACDDPSLLKGSAMLQRGSGCFSEMD